jgi:PAS domain S-box-containing protein
MKLQTKIALSIIPLVLSGIFMLGIWSIEKARENIHKANFLYMNTIIDSYLIDINKINNLLVKNGLDKVDSFVSEYKQKVLNEGASIQIADTSRILIINKSGELIFCSRKHNKNEIESVWGPLAQKIVTSSEFESESHAKEGDAKYVYVARHFKPWDWVVFFSMSDQDVHHAEKQIRNATIGIASFCSLLSILLIMIVFKKFIVGPIRIIAKAASAITDGQDIKKIAIMSKDELGGLARDMEFMSNAIQENQAEIKKSNINLENRIEKATLKLKKTNKELNQEIEERKQAETKLMDSEKKSLAWLESSPVCTKMLDLDFNLQYMSAAGIKGLNIDDITQFYGKPYPFDFYPEQYKNLMNKNLKKIKETGEIIEQEGSVVDINGNELWFHSTLVPVNDDKDQIDYIIVVSNDITGRKQAEVALKQSESKYRRLSENSPAVVYQFRMASDGAFSFPYINAAVNSIMGLAAEDILQDFSKFLGMVHPEEQEMFLEDILKSAKSLEPYHEIIRYLRNGEERWIEAQSTPEKMEDGSILWDGFLVDITEKKSTEKALLKSEEQFRTMFEQAPLGIALIDSLTGHILKANPMYAKIAGRTREEMAAIDWMKITHPDDVQADLDNMALLNAGEIKGFTINKRYIHPDGSHVWITMTIAPLEVEDKAYPHHLCMVKDITSIMKAEKDRTLLEKQLQQSQKMESIGTLAGGIAHDFNNIMAIILGNTELALDDVPKWNSAYSSLEEIKTASFRAKNIVKQLLSFSRKTDQEMQPIQIALVIKDALKFLRSTIPTTINIHRDIPAFDETILADPTQINQIIMNLCINASQAMDQTGGDLTIAMEKLSLDNNYARDYSGLKSGDHVKIMISDTGPGIDPEIIDQIFDPYFTTKEVGKGSGMGLAVVQGIVKSHGGAIAVDSKKGKGTKFSILFPLITKKPMVEAQTNKDIPRGNETILFVDDEISITKMVKRMFERLGYKVETSTTPQDALERFSLNPDHFDLVITDMTMPQMTGVKLSEKLMDIREDIPIIICTGYSNLVDEKKAKELGLAAYIMKPINMLETSQAIRKILDKN